MQKYTWFASYINGWMFAEFNPDGSENSFYNIEKDNVKVFGLMGEGNILSFDTSTGTIDINGTKINLAYDGVKLTGVQGDFKDLITYKDAEAYFNPLGGSSSGLITKFNFGYKSKVNGFNLRCIITINMATSSVNLSVRLVSSVDRDGVLSINNLKVDAPLDANHSGEIIIPIEEVV
jgi:hypothetical protein